MWLICPSPKLEWMTRSPTAHCLLGEGPAFNFLIAYATVKELEPSLDFKKVCKVSLPKGRSSRISYGRLTILDETYNSSPEAVKAALQLLSSEEGRHFAVLGTMLELGEQSIDLHRQIAEYTIEIGLDGLIIVSNGAEAKVMEKSASSLPYLAVVSSPEFLNYPINS